MRVQRAAAPRLGAIALLLAVGLVAVLPVESDVTRSSGSGVGVPSGLVLRQSDSITVDRAGTKIDGVHVRGMITVSAPDVVIRRSLLTGDGSTPWAIRTTGEGTVRIEDVTISGDYTDAGISYHNWSAKRVEIVGMTNDGAKLGNNASISDSWIHGFTPSEGAHADGLQVAEDVGNIVVERNRIDVGTAVGANAAVFLSPDIGPENPTAGAITVRHNELGGGAYTFYSVDGRDGAKLQDVDLVDNTFLHEAGYGPVYPTQFVVRSVSGNAYSDGAAVPLPPR
jgi:hypothetical protein